MSQKLFILIRRDIPEANQAVQAGHAVAQWCLSSSFPILSWGNKTLVYLSVIDKFALQLWARRLEQRSIDFVSFREPDMNNQITAIACLTDTNVFNGLRTWGDGEKYITQ